MEYMLVAEEQIWLCFGRGCLCLWFS